MSETEKTKGQILSESLLSKKENVFEKKAEKLDVMMAYAEDYKRFLDGAKTEREAVTELIRMAKENGFSAWKLGDPVKAVSFTLSAFKFRMLHIE